jgi:hypothetical protein
LDDEFNAYAVEMLKASDVLIMGRRTCELMSGASPGDTDNDPIVKEKMNSTPKQIAERSRGDEIIENRRHKLGAFTNSYFFVSTCWRTENSTIPCNPIRGDTLKGCRRLMVPWTEREYPFWRSRSQGEHFCTAGHAMFAIMRAWQKAALKAA